LAHHFGIAVVSALVFSAPAHSAAVALASCSEFPGITSCATGVTGLVIGSKTYDVTFRLTTLSTAYPDAPDGFPFPPTPSGNYLAAIDAGRLLSQTIFNAGGGGICDSTDATNCGNSAEMPYAGNYFVTDTVRVLPWTGGEINLGAVGTADSNMWVLFTPVVVPLPAAAWLFAGGLGLLGMVTRRRA
jgi:hypothetical protein